MAAHFTRHPPPPAPPPRPLTDHDIRTARFPPTPFGRRGYDATEVDAFLLKAEEAFRGTVDLTAQDVRDTKFGPSPRLGPGYREADVDAFLEAIATELARRKA
ncbi:DivIVA domain-containing protein [Actinokineospora sp. PR83]|nr:DivIVA domain-containing protein [Actinokineospora sp. PR83]